MEEYEIATDVHHKTMIQIGSPSVRVPRIRVNKSYETLSNIVRNEVGLSKSMRDMQKVGKRVKMPPIKTSKGVMQVLGDNTAAKNSRRRESVSESRASYSTPFSRTQARSLRRGSVMSTDEYVAKTPTPRRQNVSRPTTLSPIIGTPNRDSELSAASKSSDKNLVLPDSPSRIPIRSRSSSQTNSKQQGDKRATSKDGKPPVIRKTPISTTSNLSRANANKKNIPVFGSLRKTTNNKGATKTATKKVSPEKRVVKRNSSVTSENSVEETKGPGRASSRQSSPDKRTPSPDKREGTSATDARESSPDKAPSSPEKRGSSPEKRESPPVKGESPKDKRMKRLLTKESFQSKSSDSIRKKVLEKKNSFKKQQSNPDLNKLGQKRDEDDRGSINSIASAASIVGVTKAGEKFKKLVPLTKQNVVSMTTAAVVSQPAQIQTTLTNQLSQSKLVEAKKASDDSTTDPASIIEQSQKTLESIQKTMTDATDEINKTIEENLSHLKDLGTAISDSPKPGDRKPPPMLSKDSKPSSSRDLLKKRMESGTPKMGTPKNKPKTPTTPGMPPATPTTKSTIPVEPMVNVIEKPVEPKTASAAAPILPKPDPIAMAPSSDAAMKKPDVGGESGNSGKPMMNSGTALGKANTNTQQPAPAQQQNAQAASNKSSTTTKEQESKQKSAAPEGGGGKSLGVGQSGVQTQQPSTMSTSNKQTGEKGAASSVTGGGSGGVVSGSGKNSLAVGQVAAKPMMPRTEGSSGSVQKTQPQG